jgi:uncharacterized protein YndB with AHSA1/START domain
MTLQGKLQIERRAVIEATVDVVWEVLSDSRLLPDWVPVVDEVTACSTNGEEVGATRSCAAKLGGKAGTMVERCVEYTPRRRIAYLVDSETFGMRKMVDDYGFSLSLREVGPTRTKVSLQTHYTPRGPMYAAVNALMMKRQFGKVCDGIVSGLKTFCEARH